MNEDVVAIHVAHCYKRVQQFMRQNFDQAISRQLDQDWHKLKHSTRQLVNDLRTLRALFQYLIEYDCVSFYKLLLNIQASSAASRNPSLWLLTPAAVSSITIYYEYC